MAAAAHTLAKTGNPAAGLHEVLSSRDRAWRRMCSDIARRMLQGTAAQANDPSAAVSRLSSQRCCESPQACVARCVEAVGLSADGTGSASCTGSASIIEVPSGTVLISSSPSGSALHASAVGSNSASKCHGLSCPDLRYVKMCHSPRRQCAFETRLCQCQCRHHCQRKPRT